MSSSDWRNLLKNDNEPPRGFEELVDEFTSALGSEFGIELNAPNPHVDVAVSNHVSEAYQPIEEYVHGWLLNLLYRSRPELRLGISDEALEKKAGEIAKELYNFKGEHEFNDWQGNKIPFRIKIDENETLALVIHRVNRSLKKVAQHLEQAGTPSLPE